MKSTLALTLAALLACPVSSRADAGVETSEVGVNEARERFTRGVELYHEGSFGAALAEFSRAYKLAPNYRVLYNLAQLQAERHDYVAAVKLLEEYLRQGDTDIAPERLAKVNSLMTELKSRLATLWVHTSVPGAELLVDGLSVGVLPLNAPVLLSAGVHQLQLRNPGDATITQMLTIAGSETINLELPKPPADPTVRQASTAIATASLRVRDDQPETPRTSLRTTRSAPVSKATPMWMSLISTAVLAGGAVTFGALAHASDNELKRELARLPADRDRVADVGSDLQRNAALCDALTAGAVIAAGLSVYFALSVSNVDEPSSTPERRASRIGATGRGLSLVQHF